MSFISLIISGAVCKIFKQTSGKRGRNIFSWNHSPFVAGYVITCPRTDTLTFCASTTQELFYQSQTPTTPLPTTLMPILLTGTSRKMLSSRRKVRLPIGLCTNFWLNLVCRSAAKDVRRLLADGVGAARTGRGDDDQGDRARQDQVRPVLACRGGRQRHSRRFSSHNPDCRATRRLHQVPCSHHKH